MVKGFGIASVILAVLAIFAPVIGFWLAYLALILAVISALKGDRVFATITPIIAIVNFLWLSPSYYIILAVEGGLGKGGFVVWNLALAALPFVAIWLHTTGKFKLTTQEQ